MGRRGGRPRRPGREETEKKETPVGNSQLDSQPWVQIKKER